MNTVELFKDSGVFDVSPDGFFQSHFFSAPLLAEHVLEYIKFITLRDNDEIMFFDPETGIYREKGKTAIREIVTKILADRCRSKHVNETLAIIKNKTYCDREDLSSPPYYIVVENGLLNVQEQELESFQSDVFALTYLPMMYDPDAECPEILRFLHQIVRPEDIPVLQEIIGYCLLRGYPIHKAFIFYGQGRNGKTTFLNLIGTFLGRDNISAVPLQDLQKRFAGSDLYGKIANISDDLSDKDIQDTGNFKKFTGESLIRAERKFQPAFHFINHAKLIFATNRIPKTNDDSEAFFRRIILIEFPYEFTEGENANPEILSRLTEETELSGVLNWGIEGLLRLMKNGRFSISKGIEETRIKYLGLADDVFRFVHEELELDGTEYIEKQEAYEMYTDFCRRERIVTVSYNDFCRRMNSIEGVSSSRQSRSSGRVQSFRGLKVRGS